jgi:hypothetical protein
MPRLSFSSGYAPSPAGSRSRILFIGIACNHCRARCSPRPSKPNPPRCGSPSSAWSTATSRAFLHSLPQHNNVQLVGIADADPALFAKYRKAIGLCREPVLQEHGQHDRDAPASGGAGVYLRRRTPPGHRNRSPVRRFRHGGEAAHHLARRRARHSQSIARDYHIHVLVNYETTWYASNRAAYERA